MAHDDQSTSQSDLTLHRLVVALWCALAIYLPILVPFLLCYEIIAVAASFPNFRESLLIRWTVEQLKTRLGAGEKQKERLDASFVSELIEEMLAERETEEKRSFWGGGDACDHGDETDC